MGGSEDKILQYLLSLCSCQVLENSMNIISTFFFQGVLVVAKNKLCSEQLENNNTEHAGGNNKTEHAGGNNKTEHAGGNESSIPATAKASKEENENSLFWVDKGEDVQILKVTCCKNITISSTGKTLILYPAIIGSYNLKDGYYVKEGAGAKDGLGGVYLYQPGPDLYSVRYSWGVSTRLGARWGFIKSRSATTCPDMDKHWQTLEKNPHKWVRDSTLSVSCTPKKER